MAGSYDRRARRGEVAGPPTPKKLKRKTRSRRRGRGRVSPSGPYRAESGNKEIREEASSAEVKKLSRGKSRTSKRVRRLAEGDRREERAERRRETSARERERRVRREYEALDKEIPRSVDTLLRAERRLERREDKRLREATKRLRHSLASEALYKARQPSPEGSGNYPERALAELAPRSYRKAMRAHSKAGSSGGLGEPEDLTTAITLVAPGAGLVGAVGRKAAQKGVGTVAKEVGEASAAKARSVAARTSSRTLNAGSGVRAGGRLAGKAVRRAAGKDTTKVARKAAKAKAARASRRRGAAEAAARSRAASAAVPGLKLGKVSVAGTPAARGHIEAVVDSPTKTAKTTARALPGLVTVPVATAIKSATTVGRAGSAAAHEVGVPGARAYSGEEILAPVESIPKEQLDFARQVVRVLTASDSKMVKREVEESLGLMLPIMLGLGSGAVGKKISKGRMTEAVRRVVERSRERHGKGHGYRGDKAPRVLERTGQRKESARAAAKGRTRLRAELQDRQRPMLEAARGAARGEVVRKGVARGKRGRKLDLKIHDADVVSFLQRHPMKMDDPVAMLAEVGRIKGKLKDPPKGMEPSPDVLSTRDVIAYIEKRPDVLANPAVVAAVRAYRKQGATARRDPELAPEHSERARFLSAATTRDIPFPEERFPEAIRSLTRANPRRGRVAKDVLRKEARRDRSRARANRKKAATLEKKAAIMRRELETRQRLNKDQLDLAPTKSQLREQKALRAMERRGLIPRDRMPVGGHLQVVTDPRSRTPGSAKPPPKLHDRIAERIDKLDAQVVALREKAELDERMAAAKHKASSEVDPTLIDEFAADVERTLRAEGITELPEYQHAGPGRQRGAPVYGSSGSKLTQFPGKSKKRKGTAEEFGLVEEGLRPMIRESIARPVARRESYKAAREVLRANRFEPGGKRVWSAREADELFRGPDPVLSPDQWMKVPLQFSKRIEDVLGGKRGKGKITDEDFAFVAQLKELENVKGTKYEIVRSAAMQELVDQLANTLVAPKVAKVNRATSFLILGTSPAWAAMQVIAEYGQAAVAQPRLLNPAFVKKAIRSYKEMDPAKRQAFDSWVGVTTRTIEKAEDLKLDLKAGDMDAAANAYSALEATPYGRFLRGIPTAIQRVDAWKGGRIRSLATLAKIDRDLNGRTNVFLRGVGGLHREMGAAMKEMKGKSLKEQAEWVAEHPKWSHRYQGYLDDVMGNWSALTKKERVAAQAMIFYPFLRMSLRWTFYSFPKRHPIKAAMLYYLGQQNANEVAKLVEGDPSYFSQWATVYMDVGNGDKKPIDLGRIAPGSNALIEALGGSTEGPKGIAAAKVAQPALVALGTAIYGVTPLSGQQEKNSGLNALAQLLPTTLSAPGRAVTEALVPKGRKRTEGLPAIPGMPTERKEAIDKLADEIYEKGTAARYVRTLALPLLPKDGQKFKDGILLGRVFEAFEKNSSSARDDVSAEYATRMKNAVEEGKRRSLPAMKKEREARLDAMEAEYDEADRVLDELFDRYEVDHEKEDRLFLGYYAEGKYRDTDDEGGYGSKIGSVGSSSSYGRQFKQATGGSSSYGSSFRSSE